MRSKRRTGWPWWALTGLLLPSVKNTLEAARRSACMNNIRHLGLGVHWYASSRKKVFPRAGEPGSNGTWWAGESLYLPSVNVATLRFIGRAGLHDACNYDDWIDGANATHDPPGATNSNGASPMA